MLFYFSQHWNKETKRLLHKTVSAEAKVDLAGSDHEVEVTLPEAKYVPGKSHNETWAIIDEKYGKSPYERLISEYVDRLMTKPPEGFKDSLIKGSVERYMVFYKRVQSIFMKRAEGLEAKFNYSVENIKDKTRTELAVLKSAVEGTRQLAEMSGAVPSPENKPAVREYFQNYVEALNGRYLNLDVNEGVKVPGGLPLLSPFMHPDTKVLDRQAHPEEKVEVPLLGIFIGSDVFKGAGKKGYRNLSKKFAQNMNDWVFKKLEFLLQKKDISQADLVAFRDEVSERYEFYSKIDQSSDIISLRDLTFLEAVSKPSPHILNQLLEARSEKGVKWLEAMQIMNPEGWKKTVRLKGQALIKSIENAGSEKQFIKTMSKYGHVEDFDDAENLFEKELEKRAEVGVPETIEFFRDVNQESNSEILQFSRNIRPPSLSLQVYKQLDYLKNGVLVPEKQGDRMLVRFMNANRKERNSILAHPGSRRILFRAVKQATEQYPEIYEKQFSNIPDDPTKLRRSRRIERPTHHDRAAQLQALIILGNEAKVIVQQLNRSEEHAGKNYMAEIDRVQLPEDPTKTVRTGLRFKSASPSPGRYRSRLERGGFNARDLALHGVQVIGALAMVSNLAQSYSEAEGDDFIDKLFNAVESTATNQGFLAGAAMTVGSYVAKRDPRWLKYPWLSQYGKDGLFAKAKLDRLAAVHGHGEVNKLLQNEYEWRAMEKITKDSGKVKEMLKVANERRKGTKGKPVITIEDIRKATGDENIAVNLNRGTKSARFRYKFYSYFLTGKSSVNHVKELCTGSSDIATDPYDTKNS